MAGVVCVYVGTSTESPAVQLVLVMMMLMGDRRDGTLIPRHPWWSALRNCRALLIMIAQEPIDIRASTAKMTFAIGPWEKRKPDIDAWRELYEKEWNRAAPPSVASA